jgi:hypothetical protein
MNGRLPSLCSLLLGLRLYRGSQRLPRSHRKALRRLNRHRFYRPRKGSLRPLEEPVKPLVVRRNKAPSVSC